MAKKKKHKNDVKTDLPIIMDYGIGKLRKECNLLELSVG